MITIRMPKEMLEKWLAALRSGEYTQGKRALKTSDGAYCCLGVLQHCLTGEVEMGDQVMAQGLPSLGWLNRHGIQFKGLAPEADKCRAPYLPTLNCMAYIANDSKNYNFNQIADAIEVCAEGL